MKRKNLAGLATVLVVAASPAAMAQTATTPETSAPMTSAEGQTGVSGSATGAMAAGFLDQSEIEDRLGDQDFSDIDIEFADNHYTGTATWWGEQVDLRADARTGRVIEPTRMTEAQIQNRLESEGYENVSEIREAGSEFTAKAERFGEETDVRVSAATGIVLDPRELTTDQLLQALEDEGYSNVTLFEREAEYGNHRAVAEKEEDTVLLEVQPISGDVIDERAGTNQDDS